MNVSSEASVLIAMADKDYVPGVRSDKVNVYLNQRKLEEEL
jgi:hypothetical protein